MVKNSNIFVLALLVGIFSGCFDKEKECAVCANDDSVEMTVEEVNEVLPSDAEMVSEDIIDQVSNSVCRTEMEK